MLTQLFLEDQDVALMVDLLRNEREELPSELRRTDTPAVHEMLKQRQMRVNDLLHKLEYEADVQCSNAAVPD
jgi:hypothetical protein